MTIVSTTRRAASDEIVREMDRRGDVIEKLEARIERLQEALIDIDAVACDFGHFETAARTMKEIAARALK